MKDQSNIKNKLSTAFLSFFYIGYIPKMPGTWGSLATLPLILLLAQLNTSFTLLIILILALIIVSTFVTDRIQKQRDLHDPQWIVIDEVIGMLVTWAFVFPHSDMTHLIALFLLFRLFDIIKLWPASYFDKKIKHGFGTIFDDVISGMMAGGALMLGKLFF